MTYDEWLEKIKQLNNSSIDIKLIEELNKQPINPNINNLIIPKLEETIKNRFQKAVHNILGDLENIFTDEYYLDMMMVNFKKELEYILKIINLKQIPEGNKKDLLEAIQIGTDKTYKVLENESVEIDSTGCLSIVIKNNRIKWS